MLVLEKSSITREIENLVEKYGESKASLLPILQYLQLKYHYINDFIQQEVARLLHIKPIEVYSTLTFYEFLHTDPKGEYVIRLCRTITCDMAGKDKIVNTLENELGIKFGETTLDRKFTLEYTNCVGMCDQGPAMLVNNDIYISLNPEKVVEIIKKYKGAGVYGYKGR